MSANTKIEWTDHTFNPWIGCSKVSPGCDNCYAATQDKFRKWTSEGWGGPRKRTKTWGDPKKWNAEIFFECPTCHWRGSDYSCEDHREKHPGHPTGCPACGARMQRARARVFCASLADIWDNEVPIEWLVDFLDLCRRTPNLDKLILTKRIGNVMKRLREALDHIGAQPGCLANPLFKWIADWLRGQPPSDVWLGATIVNQPEADRDIPKLLATPAAVRFLSMEPLLGPVDLTNIRRPVIDGVEYAGADVLTEANRELRGCIDWVIVGGESGPGARPMHSDWARSLRDQCAAAGVPFLFKQWGEWAPRDEWSFHVAPRKQCAIKLDGSPVSDDDAPQDVGGHRFELVGKKAAGRLLDGIEHNQFPVKR